MATRKKGAAGTAPAAAPKAAAPTTPASAGAASASGDKIAEALAGATSDGAIEGVVGKVQSALAPPAPPSTIVLAQQPSQIASVLAAPVLDTGSPVGGVVSQIAADLAPTEQSAERVIKVTSVSHQGRWRIGRRFTREVTEISVDALTDDEFERLIADPQLVVDMSGAAEAFPADDD